MSEFMLHFIYASLQELCKSATPFSFLFRFLSTQFDHNFLLYMWPYEVYPYFIIQMISEMLGSIVLSGTSLIDKWLLCLKTQLPLCTVHTTLTQASRGMHP